MVSFEVDTTTASVGGNDSGGSSNVESLLRSINDNIKAMIKQTMVGKNKPEKDSTGTLALVGIAGVIVSILSSIKPVLDIVKIFISLVFLLILKLWKWLSAMDGQYLQPIRDYIAALPQRIWDFLKSLPEKIWDFLKTLPEKIWEFLKTLPGLIWEYIKIGFDLLIAGYNWIVEKLVELKDRIVERVIELKDKFVEKIVELKDKLIEKLIELKDKFVEKIVEIKDKFIEKIIELKDKLIEKLGEWKDKFDSIIDGISDLPSRIWEYMKGLGVIIAEAIRSFFGGRKVKDALITKRGEVIEFDPNDTITASKSGANIGGGSNVFNFYGVTPQEMLNVIYKEMGTSSTRATRF